MTTSFQEALRLLRDEATVEVRLGELSPDESKALVEAVQSNRALEKLVLNCSRGRMETLASGLRGSNVTVLGLHETRLWDGGAAAYAAVFRECRLECVDLGGNSIGVAGAQALAEGLRGSSVTFLCLFANSIGDEGAKVLTAVLKDCCLKGLDLGDNGIGVEGAQALAHALKESKLKTLTLYDNKISLEGARALAAALRGSILEKLSLATNPVEEEGGQALLEGLRDSSVTSLELSNSRVSDETRSQIQEVLVRNKERSFLLQMEVQQKAEKELQIKFRTLAGVVAAELAWSVERPAHELPEALLASLGAQLSFKGLSAANLRLVRPDGALVDVGPAAALLAKQLGVSTPPEA